MKIYHQAKPTAFSLVLISIVASSLACQIGGGQISDEEMDTLAAEVMSVSMLSLETLEFDGNTIMITISWPIEMDPPTFSAALLESLLVLNSSFPDVETIEVSLRHLDQPYLNIEISTDNITGLANGEIEPNTLFERMTVLDERPEPMLLRHELEAIGQRVLRLEDVEGVLYVDLLVDEPIESKEALVEQWLEIFRLLNESELDVDEWKIRWLLPDYSVTVIEVSRENYQAYLDGTLDALGFLASIDASLMQ